VGERLDEHERPAGCELSAGVSACADGITHVMQAVEEADQVIGAAEGGGHATSNRTRTASPASAARLRAASMEPSCASKPVIAEAG